MVQDKLIDIKNEALAQILTAQDSATLEEIRVEYLGKSKGKLTLIMKSIPSLPEGERAIVGRFANEVKNAIEDALASQGTTLQKHKEANIAKTEWLDVTAPAIYPPEGHLHPLTQILNEVIKITNKLGYQVVMGPEIESDLYNFERANMPKNAPSRDTQASFYLDCRNSKIQPGEMVLRTQTTNMQSRVYEKTKPPMRVLVPGKCFRVDDLDATHSYEFWQFEGFAIDKGINMTHLLGTLDYVLQGLLPGIEYKVWTTNFSFVEPGIEVVAKRPNGSWMEILGAGMVHPNVLRMAGIDPKEWSGFAFGMGLTRLALMRFQIDDIRALTNPDLRILKQF
ncbi:phenylalanine--tRNA ligase subunit alpha [Patescibacteria group bacterium]|nr:phenylalanine--tRNA ligase subunit alpha [Patescibacteria group bacterium]